jgi:hypothetical protein
MSFCDYETGVDLNEESPYLLAATICPGAFGREEFSLLYSFNGGSVRQGRTVYRLLQQFSHDFFCPDHIGESESEIK